MRIISQDRKVDIPYESVIIKINDVNQIVALIGERFFCLGSYNSLEEAKMIMRTICIRNSEKHFYYEMPRADEVYGYV